MSHLLLVVVPLGETFLSKMSTQNAYLKQLKDTFEPFLDPSLLNKLDIDLKVQGLFMGIALFVFLAWFSVQKPVYKVQEVHEKED
jgi:hypothetical protein